MAKRILAFDRALTGLAPVANLLAFDRSTNRSVDEEGRLHVENCPITKAAVNDYYGWEIPRNDELGLTKFKKYAMLRDPEELEKTAKAGGFDGIQLLDVHKPVDAKNPEKRNVAGCIGAGCFFDGEYVRTPLLSVWDAADIKSIENEEKRELSCSYAYDPVMETGVFKGLRYDGRMVNIRPNHVALCDKGRAGRDVLVSDGMPKGLRMKIKGFHRFLHSARPLFANDADIDAEELVQLIAHAAAAGDDGEGDPGDLDDDGKANDGALPPAVMELLKGKLSDEDFAELQKLTSTPGEGGANDATGDGEGEGEDGMGDDGKGDDGKGDDKRAQDRATIRSQVIKDMGDYQRACEKVRPFIGQVRLAMDAVPGGAAQLYRRALDSRKVAHKGVTQVAALEAMVDLLPQERSAHGLAMDSAPAGEVSPLDAVLPATSQPHPELTRYGFFSGLSEPLSRSRGGW